MTKPTYLLLLTAMSLSSCSQSAPKVSKTVAPDNTAKVLVDSITGNARESRDEARSLLSQSRTLAAKGNHNAAMDKRIKMLQIRSGDPGLFGVYTAIAIQQLALSDLAVVASHFDATSCRKYAAQLKAIKSRIPSNRAMLQTDKASELRSFDRLTSNPRQWRTEIINLGFDKEDQATLLKMPVAQIRANIESLYNGRIHRASQPYSNNRTQISTDPYTRYTTRYSSVPKIALAKYRLELLFAIVALEQRANQLQNIKRTGPLPIDPFGIGPLKAKNGVIYSIGPDTKDDGGKSVPKPSNVQPGSLGDILAPSFYTARK